MLGQLFSNVCVSESPGRFVKTAPARVPDLMSIGCGLQALIVNGV